MENLSDAGKLLTRTGSINFTNVPAMFESMPLYKVIAILLTSARLFSPGSFDQQTCGHNDVVIGMEEMHA